MSGADATLRAAEAVPLPPTEAIDVDDLQNVPTQTTNEPESPAKRPQGAASASLTLDDFTRALTPWVTGMRDVQNRMRGVEKQVAQKVGHALDLIIAVGERQISQTRQLQDLHTKFEAQQQK